MTDDQLNLGILNRRTVISAVRGEAARAGVDAEQLLDSARFYNEVTALDPDDVAFPRLVAEAVREAADHAAARGPAATAPTRAAGQPPAAQPDARRQWTEADVAALPKSRAGSEQLQEAIDAGLLADLGVGPHRRRR